MTYLHPSLRKAGVKRVGPIPLGMRPDPLQLPPGSQTIGYARRGVFTSGIVDTDLIHDSQHEVLLRENTDGSYEKRLNTETWKSIQDLPTPVESWTLDTAQYDDSRSPGFDNWWFHDTITDEPREYRSEWMSRLAEMASDIYYVTGKKMEHPVAVLSTPLAYQWWQPPNKHGELVYTPDSPSTAQRETCRCGRSLVFSKHQGQYALRCCRSDALPSSCDLQMLGAVRPKLDVESIG